MYAVITIYCVDKSIEGQTCMLSCSNAFSLRQAVSLKMYMLMVPLIFAVKDSQTRKGTQ